MAERLARPLDDDVEAGLRVRRLGNGRTMEEAVRAIHPFVAVTRARRRAAAAAAVEAFSLSRLRRQPCP